MVVDLQNRPSSTPDSDENNPGQQRYNDEFNALPGSQNLANNTRSDVPISTGERGLYNANRDANDKVGKADGPAIGTGVALDADNNSKNKNFAFNPLDTTPWGRALAILKSRKGQGAMLGGGGLIGIVVLIFFLLIPLKIENIVSSLQNRFFATSNSATEDETENLLSGYVKKEVLPALSKCSGNTVDKSCNSLLDSGTSPIDALYRGWHNARLENKLATDYGIEFKAVHSGSVTKYYLKTPSTTGADGEDITKIAGSDDTGDLFTEIKRNDIRAQVRNAMQDETKWKQVMYRFKVGRLLEEKYGVKRCIFFCGTQDALNDFKNEQKNAAKIWLIQRVIVPRTQSLGIVMECLTDPNCEPEKTEPTDADPGTDGELSGAPENPETDGQIRTTLQGLAENYGIVDKDAVDELIKQYNAIDKSGYQKYALDAVLEKLGIGELSDNASDAAPVVGYVNQASQLVSDLQESGPKTKKLSYEVNSAAAVDTFEMFDTYADEIHTGHISATELGSMTDELSAGDHGLASDAEVGGTASAEQSPLYSKLIDDDNTTGGGPASDTCDGGSSVPKGKFVCPEEVLGQGNAVANDISTVLDTPPLSYIATIAHTWNSTVGKVFNLLSDLFGKLAGIVPGVSDITSLLSKVIQPFYSFLEKKLIPSPFGSNMSGARTFDMMAAGADVSGNDYAHTGLGGQLLTSSQVATITNQQDDEAKQQLAQSSTFARIFSTTNTHSLISTIALEMPASAADARASFASLMTDPFASIAHNLALIINPKARAAAQATPDDFNVPQYGYTNITSDPNAYWNAHCSDNAAQAYQNDQDFQNAATNWNGLASSGATDPNTGMPVNTTSNQCLLIMNTVGSAGGIFDTNLLTQDEQSDL